MSRLLHFVLLMVVALFTRADATEPMPFLEKYCIECHNTDAKQGGLDLTVPQGRVTEYR